MTATYADTILSTLSPEAYRVPTAYGWYAQASWINSTRLPGIKPKEAENAESNLQATHIAVYPQSDHGVNAFTEKSEDEIPNLLGIAVFQQSNSSMDEPDDPESYLLHGADAEFPGLIRINDLDVIVQAENLAEALEYIKGSLGIIDAEKLNENSKGLLSFGEVIASFDLFTDLAGRGKCKNIDTFNNEHRFDKCLNLVKVVDDPDNSGDYSIYLLAVVSVDDKVLHSKFNLHKDSGESEREMARLILSRLNFASSNFLYLDPMEHVDTEDGITNAYWMLVQLALEG